MTKKVFYLLMMLFLLGNVVLAQNEVTILQGMAIPDKNQVNISWGKVAGAEVSGYNIYRKKVDEADFNKINSAIVGSEELSYNDESVERGERYLYAIKTVNTDGTEGELSKVLGVPRVTVLGRSQEISHEWDDGDTPVPGATITYKIEFANEGYTDAHDVVFTDTVPDGTTYEKDSFHCSIPFTMYFWVAALNEGKGGWTTEEPKKTTIIKKLKWIVDNPVPPIKKMGEVSGAIIYSVKINYL